MDAGADVCVTSIHKMGSGLEQSSVFRLQGDLIAPELLKERADLFSTAPRWTAGAMVDVSGLGTGGYQVADWLREHHQVNVGLADHRRVGVQLTHADDEHGTSRLLSGLHDLSEHAAALPPAPRLRIPPPSELRLEQAMLPRDAFFGPAEHVPWHKAGGRITVELLTPYPPGIPAALPGERLTPEVLEYLHNGLQAGMVIPDAADPSLKTIRVVA
jgi:arginine/lysine/ornithine decarboxylase